MQIIGRRYADADVLAASAAFEQLRPWAAIWSVCGADIILNGRRFGPGPRSGPMCGSIIPELRP